MIYSTLFYLNDAFSGSATLYTVPSGMVAVLRDLEWRADGGTGSQLYVGTTRSGEAPYWYTSGLVTSNVAGRWQGRQVIEAGDMIIATEGGDAVWALAVTGYLLTI